MGILQLHSMEINLKENIGYTKTEFNYTGNYQEYEIKKQDTIKFNVGEQTEDIQ